MPNGSEDLTGKMNIKEEVPLSDDNMQLSHGGLSGNGHKQSFHSGYVYGKYYERTCQKLHKHSLTGPKVKDIDLAELQSKAFKFMILQKPKVSVLKAAPGAGAKPYQASFLPDNKMPEELQKAFDQNNEFRELM